MDPLTSPICSGTTKVISVIEDQDVIKKILKHLGLWEVKPRPPPRMAKTQFLNTEPHIDYSGSQIPLPIEHAYSLSLIQKQASCLADGVVYRHEFSFQPTL